MEIREGWVAVICIVVAVVAFNIGRVSAFEGTISDCKKLEKFQYMNFVYECRQVPRSE